MGADETKEYLDRRKTSYQLVFNVNQPADAFVMEDLAFFCRANETCIVRDANGKYDPYATAVLEGRREVFLRIIQHLGLTPEQLFVLYGGTVSQRRS